MADQALKTPQWELIYNGVDQAPRISQWVLSVVYNDPLDGESAEIEIVLEDSEDLWKGPLLPGKGATISLAIGYQGETLLQCGEFQLDELIFDGPPDTVTIRSMAAGINPALRTLRSVGYENTTLRRIAEKVASRHRLNIVGSVPDIKIQRATQHKESDLSFLRRLASSWGFIFSLRGKKLIWHDQERLDGAAPVTTITRKKLAGRYNIRSKSERVYRAARVTYWSPNVKRDVTRTITVARAGVKWGGSGDVLHLVERCESLADAKRKAAAAIRRANGRQTEGSITVFGDQHLVAGVNLTLSGWAKLDRVYQATKTVHRIDRKGGYKTTAEFGLAGTYGLPAGVPASAAGGN